MSKVEDMNAYKECLIDRGCKSKEVWLIERFT